MKYPLLSFCTLFFLASCHNKETKRLEARIDSLTQKIDDSYKPGFGEFMSGIQVHHAKLWFAGLNNNWELADFEVHEIIENLDAIKKYQSERTESGSLSMLAPALDSVTLSIQQKNLSSFKSSYLLLTNSCNNCHKAVNYSFNEVKIPDSPPFSNQVFGKQP